MLPALPSATVVCVITAHSAHRSYQKLPASKVVRIDYPELASEEAVFCVVGCMGFQGVRRCRVELGESVMVMGLGLLGQFAVQTAALSGALPVIALDFNVARRNIALKRGADAAFSPDMSGLEEEIKAMTGGGCSSVIEITGNPQAVVQGLQLTAPGGRISLVGCSRTPTENIDFYNLVHRPGITVLGAHNMARPLNDGRPGVWTMRDDMKTLLRFMNAGKVSSRDVFRTTRCGFLPAAEPTLWLKPPFHGISEKDVCWSLPVLTPTSCPPPYKPLKKC